MKYRQFSKRIDWKVSSLGFGIMRMPLLDRETGEIDEDESVKMIRLGIDRGINYIDTAYPYHSGKSEPLVARALRGGYREKVKLATKLPSWLIETEGDPDRFFNEQLKRLETSSIDFYLLHDLNVKNWNKLKKINIIGWLEEKKRSGLIRYAGFSFHDELPLFREIIDSSGIWDFCQVQYNFMDRDYQAGADGISYAASKGLGIVVMEPLKGGQLAYRFPASVDSVWKKSALRTGPVERAFSWLWDQKEISVVLSGMSSLQQVMDNTEFASRYSPGCLDDRERALYEEAAEAYRALSPVPCTECGYCMPCPFGVDIPKNFDIYNDAVMYGSDPQCREIYQQWFDKKHHADKCTECGECVPLCPQKINIPEELKKVEKRLGEENR